MDMKRHLHCRMVDGISLAIEFVRSSYEFEPAISIIFNWMIQDRLHEVHYILRYSDIRNYHNHEFRTSFHMIRTQIRGIILMIKNKNKLEEEKMYNWDEIFEALKTETEIVNNLLSLYEREPTPYERGFKNGMEHTDRLLHQYANREENHNENY